MSVNALMMIMTVKMILRLNAINGSVSCTKYKSPPTGKAMGLISIVGGK